MPPAAEPYGSGTALVFDTSAWSRQRDPRVLPRWRATLAAGLLTVCPVVALELLASVRDEQAFRDLDQALAALAQAPVTRAACDRALGATESAVNAFKTAVGLPPNGAVGPNPWNAFVDGFLTAASAGEANEAVFAAWTHADPDAAKRNATPAAVEELFAQTWHPDVWTFAGSGAAAGSVYSTWKSAGTELVLRANDGTGTPFNYTTSATF